MNETYQYLLVYGIATGLFLACSLVFVVFSFIAFFWNNNKSKAQVLLYGSISLICYALFNSYIIKNHIDNLAIDIFPYWIETIGKVCMPLGLYFNSRMFIQAIPLQSLSAFTAWHRIKPFYYLVDAMYLTAFMSMFFITSPSIVIAISMILTIITLTSGVLFAHNATKPLRWAYKAIFPFIISVHIILMSSFLLRDIMVVPNIVFISVNLLNSISISICIIFFIAYLSGNKDSAHRSSMISHTEELYRDVVSAIENNYLFLEYQPKIEIESGTIIGIEALVRLSHPEKGIIFPDQFIPIAEQSELINNISKWVINQAIKDAKILSGLDKTIPISINFSVKDMECTMITYFLEQLHEHQVPPNLITIEVTESLILDMTIEQKLALSMIKESQINISLDDFSAGFSSLRYIDELGLDELKIDKDLTFKLLTNNKKIIISMIVNMCQELGIKVVAEGVEDDKILQVLKDINCHVAQGYAICKPKKLEDLLDWCKEEGSEFCNSSCYC